MQRVFDKSVELGVAAPQVIAQRVQRMLTAGPVPSARDQREFLRMGSEKVSAFQQSWMAMGLTWWQQCLQAQQQWLAACTAMNPLTPMRTLGTLSGWWMRPATMANRVLDAGLTPVHAKAVGNARRLARESRRRPGAR